MKISTLLILSTAVTLLCSTGCTTIPNCGGGEVYPASKSTLESKFAPNKFTSSTGMEIMARLYLPTPTRPTGLPLIVYLHGAGQNGSDNEHQLDDSLGCLYAFTHDRDDYRSAILAPQCPVGTYWRDDDTLASLMELIRFVADISVIDKDRIYITGFSMGGDASWKIALADPSLPTTIIPVCGGPMTSMEPDIPDVPDEMADMNIWAFNNFDDGVVRPTYSKRIFSRLWELSPTSETLNFTENVSGGHNPKQVYRCRDVLIWMLNTHR